ncbi:MAG TPA: glycosyltransferase [Gaiellaceae bacterium]|nr:glycosyltransferase [Gaiellaceae bacterium]
MTSALEQLKAEGLHVALSTTRLGWSEYLDVLAASRVAISVRGLGYDTYRYWEIPYSGAVLLAETPRIVIPGNFEHGREAWFAPVGGLADSARTLVESDTQAIATAGRTKLLREHSSIRRAETVLERLDSVKARRRSSVRSVT